MNVDGKTIVKHGAKCLLCKNFVQQNRGLKWWKQKSIVNILYDNFKDVFAFFSPNSHEFVLCSLSCTWEVLVVK
jgi:hypothetical protein